MLSCREDVSAYIDSIDQPGMFARLKEWFWRRGQARYYRSLIGKCVIRWYCWRCKTQFETPVRGRANLPLRATCKTCSCQINGSYEVVK